MAREPRHREISRRLLEEIAQDKYADGRLPTEAQLVKRFKVSRPTVARALRDLQDQGLVRRRAGSGTYLNGASAAPALGNRQLGLLIPGLGSTEIFEVICGELAGLARIRQYYLLWGAGPHPRTYAQESIESAEEICDQYIQRKVAGVFFAPFEHVQGMEEVNRRLVERFRQAGIAVVLLDRDIGPFGLRSEFDLVGIDNVTGGYLAAGHLLKLGSRKPLFVARPLSASTINARVAGAREALMAAGVTPPGDFLRVGECDDAKFVASLGAGMDCDALICGNDQTAAVLMRSLERMRIRVPQNVRLIGFDDVRWATLLSVPLTTIHQPCRDIALVALRTMLERIHEPMLPPRSLYLTPSLIVRESCGAYLPRRR